MSGWHGPVMRITLGFSLQTGQFVKNRRLLLWCQTLKLAPLCSLGDTTGRKTYYKNKHFSQKNYFYFFFKWMKIHLWTPVFGLLWCEPPPPAGPVFLKSNKINYVYQCLQNKFNKQKAAFRCEFCTPLLLERRKSKEKNFSNILNIIIIRAGSQLEQL